MVRDPAIVPQKEYEKKKTLSFLGRATPMKVPYFKQNLQLFPTKCSQNFFLKKNIETKKAYFNLQGKNPFPLSETTQKKKKCKEESHCEQDTKKYVIFNKV